ncbi:MAG TPA: carboxypeptidase-like regulatory domain-containing protein [Pyrinomonadaceae bacterium]|nr:carboxypeptidase-like regulatory domain-containing protein [Pyrinomonadaceae bacterium]
MFYTLQPGFRRTRIAPAIAFLAVCFVSVASQTRRDDQTNENPGVIRGRVVYADTGRPLRRGDVTLLSSVAGGSWVAATATDRNGLFTFSNVAKGKYFVTVKALDVVNPLSDYGSDHVSIPERIAMGQIEDGYREVTIDGRGSVRADIRVTRGGAITGRVLAEDESPIAGAYIKVYRMVGDKILGVAAGSRSGDSEEFKIKTDSRGSYRAGGLAGGEYLVRASESDLGENSAEAAEGSYGNGSMVTAYHPKALRKEDATRVQVVIGADTKEIDILVPDRSLHRIGGNVIIEGSPASGADISLYSNDESAPDFFSAVKTRSDDDGAWEIPSIPDGIYVLTISGYAIGITERPDRRRYVRAAPEIREVIVAGSDVSGIKIDLLEGGELSGTVSVEGRLPVPERLRVDLIPLNPGKANSNRYLPFGESMSGFVNNAGRLSIRPVRPGLFYFRVQHLGDDLYVKAITLNQKDVLRNPIKIEGRNMEGLNVVLSGDLGALAGKVVNRQDKRKPFTDAAILLLPVDPVQRRITDGPLIARTNQEGRFLIKGAPGEYFVFVFDRQRKNTLVRPTEEKIVRDSARLPRVRLQPGNEKKVIELLSPE